MEARQQWRRFRRSRMAMIGASVIVFLIVVAIFAPILANERPIVARTTSGLVFPAFRDLLPGSSGLGGGDMIVVVRAPIPHSPNAIDLDERLAPPSRAHWLGTDELGRDVLSRIVHGSRVSLAVGIMAAVLALIVGVAVGSLAGYYGGVTDWLISRLIEVVLCFPFLFLVLAIVALFRPSMITIMIALGLTSWTNEARFVRGELLRVREMEFAHAARASGAGDARIIFRHLLPNALAPALVSTTFGVASAILIESALSFLGLGVPLPAASWGSIMASADEYIVRAWWLAVFPGIAIFLTVASFNAVGERLRDVIDPTS